ncbi:MAG: glycosyltransferase family 4 protein [Desulfobacterales bacterium]|nr:glycosyltransferase family 4 protein [Desulfobacterales bacterium]
MTTDRQPGLGMILKGYPRISEVFISNEILLLERRGFRVHIFSMRQPREKFTHASVNDIRANVDYLPETMLRYLPQLLFHNILVAGKKPRQYFKALDLMIHRLVRTRKSASIKHLLQAGYLVSRFLAHADVVHLHAHFAHSPASVAMYTSMLSGLPFSFTAHAKDIYTSDPQQLREKMAKARFVITCTRYNRRYLNQLYSHGTKAIHSVYHGIDVNLFNHQSIKPEPEPPFQLLTVARLIPKKGLPTVYRALRRLHDQGLPFKHTLIGDGDDRRRILALVKELKLEPVTQWLGTQPHEVVRQHYQRADLFMLGCEIAPDGDRDGIPNVILESMAMGVPVVATRVSAIPEIIEDGQTGVLVSPGDPEALAAAVKKMLSDAALRRRIIKKAAQKVQHEFDNKRLINELVRIYQTVFN